MSRAFRALSVALIVAIVTFVLAAVGGARNTDLTISAKLAPNVITRGEAVNYKSSFTNNQSTSTHLVFTAKFPAGTTGITTLPAPPICTVVGLDVTCDFGNVAAGVVSSVEIRATSPSTGVSPYKVTADWGFKDVKGQGDSSGSEDHFDVSRERPSHPSSDGSISGKCLTLVGGNRGLSAFKDASSIVMQTPELSSGLCVPVAVQVVSPGQLMSFGPLFGSGNPATLVLGFADKKKTDPLTYTPDVGPSFVVQPCDVTPITEVAACEPVARKTSGKVLFVTVLWIGDDPFWNM
jgi:hypothetical protein